MDKLLKIALMLTAIDNMSNVVNNATTNAMSSMKKLKAYSMAEFGNGFMMLEAGKQGFESMKPAVDAFGDMQEAGIRLQNSLMKPGGIFDKKVYDNMYKSAQHLSDGYTGSTEDYLKMMEVLKNNKISPDEILGGIGEATAKLGHLFKMQPAAIGEFAAHMRNDMGVPVKDMQKVMDLTQRIQAVGVGKSGEETVYELNQFFSKVGLGLANLKVQGIESSKAMGALGAIFMSKGLSGENVGTNFRRILDGLRDPAKIKKAMELAQGYGLKGFNMHINEGDPLGVEHFVAKLGMLKGMSTEAVAAILKPFSGRQGLSTDFLELLAHSGVGDYNSMAKRINDQGTLTQKEANLHKGLNQNILIFKSSWKNTIAEIGSAAAPFLTKMFVLLNKCAVALRNFVHNHPQITKIAMGFLSVVSAALMFGGAFKIVKVALKVGDMVLGISKALKWLRIAFALVTPGLWSMITATWSFTVALLANPITWIVLAVVGLGVAVYMLIKHWDKVGPFFKKCWDNIKKFFWMSIKFLIDILTRFTPVGLIFKHWAQISAWFHNVWEKVKHIFLSSVAWLLGLGPRMFDAGKNIVMSIWNGIKALAHKPVEAIKNMVGKIRNLLPFSPAKDGPLRDIHKIRLVETIAESLKPNILIDKMRSIASTVFELRPQHAQLQPLAVNGNGGSVIVQPNFTFNYHAAPGQDANAGAASFMEQVKKNMPQLVSMIQKGLENSRRGYS